MVIEWVSDGKRKIQLWDSGKVSRFEYKVTQVIHSRRGTTTVGTWHTITDPPLEGTAKEQWAKALTWYGEKVK